MSDDSSNNQSPKRSWLVRLFQTRAIRAFVIVLWVLFGFIVSQMLAVGLFWLVSPLFATGAPLNAVVVTTVLSGLVYALALAIVVGVMWRLRHWSMAVLRERLGLQRRARPKDLGVALLGYIPYIVASVAITVIIAVLVPGFDVEQQQELGFDALGNSFEFILAFFALVILAPFAEELLFRGYLFGTLRRLAPFWLSAVIVSVLFGLVHGQWNVALDTFALSIILCYLREYTGAVWAPILLHMVKNGLAFSLLFMV